MGAEVMDDHRWFAASDRGAPQEMFDDVTIVSSPEIEVDVEEEPPARPAPTPLPAGERRDERFADLNVIVEEIRAVLTGVGMREPELDSVEWKLRERIAKR